MFYVSRMWRGSQEELGDVLEEYPRQGLVWLLRQAWSSSPSDIEFVLTPQRRPFMLTTLWADILYAARGLRRNPGFSVTAILAIALGIGINTGIFSVFNGVVLRDIPSPAAARLSSLHQILNGVHPRMTHGTRSMVSMAELTAYRDQTPSLEALAGYAPFWEMTLGPDAGVETPVKVNGDLVTCNYFETLQMPMALGSGFTAENCSDTAASHSVILTHDLWRNQFAADPAILGQSITLNRVSLRVVGVAAEGFQGIEVYPARYFAPLSTQPELYESPYYDQPNTGWIQMFGLRKPGISEDRLRADLGLVASRLDETRPAGSSTVTVSRVTPFAMPEVRTMLLTVGAVVMAAFGLVLLIACANVANLMLARAAGRTREMTVRLAIGASRGRLIQMLLAESLLIAAAGGILGSVLALWSFQFLVAVLPGYLPPEVPGLHLDTSPDQRVLLFAFVVTLVTGIAFGLIPALSASRQDLASGMKQDSAGAGRRTRGGLRGALVGVQVAVCTVLLVSAGLLLRGLHAAQTLEPGFRYANNLVATYDLRGAGYDGAKSVSFQTELVRRLRGRLGEHAVALSDDTPLSPGNSAGTFSVKGGPQEVIEVNSVSPDYFDIIETPLVMGRGFAPEDNGQRVLVVNEGAARHFWPGQNPVGQTLLIGDGTGTGATLTVIGVVKDAQLIESSPGSTPYLYFPPNAENQLNLRLLVRARASFTGTAAIIREEMRALDPGLLVNIAPLQDNLNFWSSASQLIAGLSSSLGILALVLASIGVYSVVAYAVNRRIRELGVRMALGANRAQIRTLVMRQTMRPVIIGAAIGLILSAFVSRILESLLFGIGTHDALAFGGAALCLGAIAALATLLPVQRALRTDPMAALRYE